MHTGHISFSMESVNTHIFVYTCLYDTSVEGNVFATWHALAYICTCPSIESVLSVEEVCI